jgi:gluconolactonase
MKIASALSVLVTFGHVTRPAANAQVTHTKPEAAELVAADAAITKLGGDMKFVEGPVWIAAENRLLFSDIPAKMLMEWTAEKGVRPVRPTAASNGNTLDGDGRLVSCQHATRNVVRRDAGDVETVVVERFEGKKFNSPNDAVVKRDGTIWFTDPPYGIPAGEAKEQEENRVYCFDPKSKSVRVVSREFDMPNGLAFSPDETRLYIADSGKKQRVGVFEVKADGTLSEAVRWLEGGADGVRTDAKGNLYTTAGDGVRIYNPEGDRIATIALPEKPANCAFGGKDGKTLFVTARTGLYAVPVLVGGSR